tara:strand:- start:101 stop:1081 length:981 start_codon:yes stop_codon:yes gene_type:complete
MSNNKKRVLSGIQPSGYLHLGNYFGMMSKMIDYQAKNDLFCFIADYHALTANPSPKILSSNTFNAVCDFLALGLSPDRTTFWVQSDVPEVTELSWILSSYTGVGLMDRSTTYKDKISKGLKPNMGLYSYPILMAADILLYNSNLVPVGKDQKQHIEMARDIANKFNANYGEVFILPEPDIVKETQLIPGIDGQKMSKSYNNTIPIFGKDKEIRKKIMSIITDNASVNDPKDKDTPLFHLYCLFADKSEKQMLSEKYDAPGLRYGDVKLELFEKIMDYFAPYRKERAMLQSKPDDIKDILSLGAKKAKSIALEVLDKVRSTVGLQRI